MRITYIIIIFLILSAPLSVLSSPAVSSSNLADSLAGSVASAPPCGTAPPTYYFDSSICDGTGTALLMTTPGTSFNTVKWYDTSTATTTSLPNGTSKSFTSPTTKWISSYNTSTGCESTRIQVIIANNTTPAPPNISSQTVCSGTVVLNASGSNVMWFTSANQHLYSGSTYTVPNLQQTTSYVLRSHDNTLNCVSQPTNITVTVKSSPPPPFLTDITSTDVYGTGDVIMNVAPVDGNAVRWYAAATGGTPFFTGTQYSASSVVQGTTYYVSYYNSTLQCESPRTSAIPDVHQLVPPTSVKTEIIRVADVKQESSISFLTPEQKTTAYQHFDGLLRMVQQNISSASPSGNAIVQPVEYDQFGRASKSYLPFVSDIADGAFISDFKTKQLTFYSNSNDKIANDTEPYSQTVYETSPLGRILHVGGVGAAFQPNLVNPANGKTTRLGFSYNDGSTNSESEEVRNLKSDGSSTGFYALNKLSRTSSTDPQGNVVISYQDDNGNTICVKQQLGEVIDGVTVNYLQTYYVYDDFGRIKYIISPKGTAALKGNSWTLSQSILDQYVHQFVYDYRGRVVEKKVPGQAVMFYVYDKLNRLVLTQDGLLRAQNKWLFLKYDRKGRAIMQGTYFNTSKTTRTAMQTEVDGYYTTGHATFPPTAFHESRGSALHGYTDISFPKSNGETEVWKVNYYDTYDFDFNGTTDYSYTAQGLTGENTVGRSFGLPTGSKNFMPGTATWLTSYIFYDQYARPIQVRSNNHLSSAIDNLSTTAYDFEGKVRWTKTYHNAGVGKQTTVLNNYEYDDMGRLLKIFQSNDGSANQLVLKYEYNELGQRVDTKMHEITVGSNTFLQSVDLRYNIQGMLISMNNSDLTSDSGVTNDDVGDGNDYFGMEYLYNTIETGLSNTARFDGNISAVKWKGMGMDELKSYSAVKRSYKYEYDKSNKLKSATYQALSTGTSWNREVNVFNEAMTYDQNGNIKTLQRNSRQHQLSGIVASYTSQVIDNLTYSYSATLGDQLIKVEDASANTEGFANGANIATEYTYDVNGNVTADQNKTVSGVTYNLIGKPTLINFTDGRRVEYTYTATGTKITMKSYAANSVLQTTTEYVGQFVYENSVLSFFGSPGGRVVKKGIAFEYQYNISDHQGNTRVLFSSVAPVTSSPQTGFESSGVVDRDNFSLSSQPVMNHTASGTKSQLLHGGNNSQVGVTTSLKVYPGDKIKAEVYAKYRNLGTNASSLPNFALALTSAFNVTVSSPGELANVYQGMNNFGSLAASASRANDDDASPKGFITIMIFDKNHKLLDAAWDQIDVNFNQGTNIVNNLPFDLLQKEIIIKEEGYVYVFVSNENATQVDIHFDDFKVTHTPTNILQYNEYYPFGLQTSNSWTRENNKNDFLYNAGSEKNSTTGWYDLAFRNYDPVLGRFMQVDPLATSEMATYQYAGNNPVRSNDPSGLFENCNCSSLKGASRTYAVGSFGYYWYFDDSATPGMGADGHAEGAGGGGLRVAGPSVEELEQKYRWKNLISNAPEGKTTYEFDNNSKGEIGYYEKVDELFAGAYERFVPFGKSTKRTQGGGADCPNCNIADHIRNLPLLGPGMPNPFYGAEAIYVDGGLTFVGAEVDVGGFFILAGKDKGKFVPYYERAGGGALDAGVGGELGRIDVGGSMDIFTSGDLFGNRKKVWGSYLFLGVAFAWSETEDGRGVTSISLQAGPSWTPLEVLLGGWSVGGNTGTVLPLK